MSATPESPDPARSRHRPACRRREQAAQTTRDNILKAAIKVFARYGYDGGASRRSPRRRSPSTA
jgi:hypothetical protein